MDPRATLARRALRGTLLVVSVTWLAGCQRGCLGTTVEKATDRKHGVAAPLAAVDCPDGLARCVEGLVEASRAYGYSVPCSASPEACSCPWERVTTCARGCAAEAVVLPLAADVAAEQLCAPSGAVSLPAPPPMLAPTVPAVARGAASAEVPWTSPLDVATCEGERYRCTGGLVVGCEPASHAIGRCLLGCAVDDATIEEEAVTDRAATDVLCRHQGVTVDR